MAGMAPERGVRRLLGKALARYRENHWAWLDAGTSIHRAWWAPAVIGAGLEKLGEERGWSAAQRLDEEVKQTGT
jgi:hypothetical protein